MKARSSIPNSAGVTILRLPRYFGRTKALNIGTRTAAGDYLFFLTPEVEAAAHHHSRAPGPPGIRPGSRGRVPFVVEHRIAAGAAVLPPADARYRRRLDSRHHRSRCRGDPSSTATFQAFWSASIFVKGINYLDERYGESLSDAELCYQIRRAGAQDAGPSAGDRFIHSEFALLGIGPHHPGGRPTPRRRGLFRKAFGFVAGHSVPGESRPPRAVHASGWVCFWHYFRTDEDRRITNRRFCISIRYVSPSVLAATRYLTFRQPTADSKSGMQTRRPVVDSLARLHCRRVCVACRST